jgi:prophage antirepressor-like protein
MSSRSSSALIPIDFEGRQIHVFTDEQDEPWFAPADYYSTLGIHNIGQEFSLLNGEEKTPHRWRPLQWCTTGTSTAA